MIADKRLRGSGGASGIELGLNSYTCFDRKASTTTETCSNESQPETKPIKPHNKY